MITAQNGRYGPYLKKGTDTRSIDSEEKIFEIDIEGAVARFAEPKYAGRRTATALKTFEEDPVSGKPILLKDGRFGPYVTDSEINATVRLPKSPRRRKPQRRKPRLRRVFPKVSPSRTSHSEGPVRHL